MVVSKLFFISFQKSVNIRPIIYGTIVTLFWNVFAIIMPCVEKDFYKKLKDLPNPIDYSDFYDGEIALSRNSSTATEMHPFVVRFMQKHSIYDHEVVILGFLFILLSEFVYQAALQLESFFIFLF